MSTQPSYDLLVFGLGGHGRVVIELAAMLGYNQFGVFDDNAPPVGAQLHSNITYLGRYDERIFDNVPLIIAVGNNQVRATLASQIKHPFTTLVHPGAVVAPSVKLGPGTVILANAVVQSNSSIGAHCIINASAVIDHDVLVGDFVHVRPLSYLASHSSVSSFLTIEPGQVVERFCKL